MTRLPHRATALEFVLVSGLMFATMSACSSDPAASTGAAQSSFPTSTAPATPSSAPATSELAPLRDLVSEPVLPPAEFSEAGAEAFLQYVIDAVNWAYATGDASYLTAVCADTSDFCVNVAEGAQQLVDESATRHGGEVSIVRVTDTVMSTSITVVSIEVASDAYQDLSSTGDVLDVVEQQTSGMRGALSFDSSRWVLNGLGLIA